MEKQILIVDDCGTTRKLLSYIFKEKGFNIISASNGIEALEVMATNRVDLVITDLNMPQMDGLELSRNIRSSGSYCKLPIVMVSTESEEHDMELGIEAGVTKYLKKPVSPQKLLDEVAKLFKESN